MSSGTPNAQLTVSAKEMLVVVTTVIITICKQLACDHVPNKRMSEASNPGPSDLKVCTDNH